MSKYLLIHRHDEGLCQVVHQAWTDWESPLLPSRAPETCRRGGHTARWIADAEDPTEALSLLPPVLADRSEVIPLN